MPRIENYEQTSFDAVEFKTGVYELKIIGAEDITLDWADLAIAVEFDKTEGIPFQIKKHFSGKYPYTRENGSESKGTMFIISGLVDATQIGLDKQGNFNTTKMVGRTITCVVFKNENGFADIYTKVFPANCSQAQKDRLWGGFQKDVKKGYVKLFDPNKVPESGSQQSKRNAASSDPIDDGSGPGDDDDLPF